MRDTTIVGRGRAAAARLPASASPALGGKRQRCGLWDCGGCARVRVCVAKRRGGCDVDNFYGKWMVRRPSLVPSRCFQLSAQR